MSYTHAEMTQFERDAAASSDPPKLFSYFQVLDLTAISLE